MQPTPRKKTSSLSRGQLGARRRGAFRERLMAGNPALHRTRIRNRWKSLHKNYEREARLLEDAIFRMSGFFKPKIKTRILNLLARPPKGLGLDEQISYLEKLYDACIGPVKKARKPLPKEALKIAGIRRGNRRIQAEIAQLIKQTVILELEE